VRLVNGSPFHDAGNDVDRAAHVAAHVGIGEGVGAANGQVRRRDEYQRERESVERHAASIPGRVATNNGALVLAPPRDVLKDQLGIER
jgi:hypothetical protein